MNAWTVDILPNTTEWRAWRREGCGGSDIPTILGRSPYADATLRNLAAQKLQLVPDPDTESYPMRRGRYLEPKARKMFSNRYLVDVNVACIEHREFRHHRASLDGVFQRRDLEWHIVEIKCLDHPTHLQFGRVVDGEAPVSSLPIHLLLQVQWQLYVSGADCCYLCNYSIKKGEERQLHVVRLYPEPVLWTGFMVPPVDAFWDNVQGVRNGYADFDEVFPEERHADSQEVHPVGDSVPSGNSADASGTGDLRGCSADL